MDAFGTVDLLGYLLDLLFNRLVAVVKRVVMRFGGREDVADHGRELDRTLPAF